VDDQAGDRDERAVERDGRSEGEGQSEVLLLALGGRDEHGVDEEHPDRDQREQPEVAQPADERHRGGSMPIRIG
jgi:hypothetical protein